MASDSVTDPLSLLDWRREVGDVYALIRATPDKRHVWRHWQKTRRRLFRQHRQSPIPAGQRLGYGGPYTFDYDPSWRALGSVEAAEPTRLELATSTDGVMAFRRFGLTRFTHAGSELSPELYWLEGYGGGLLLPFGDVTNGKETYGAGRYLFDTAKGADLGLEDGLLALDFNFAYQPSCAYDPRWTCPLAPAANRLAVPVRAGERVPANTDHYRE
jgi:uncharacterized protein (DUF1684 family)